MSDQGVDDLKPRPDPSSLTTAQLHRELEQLRAFFDRVLVERDRRYEVQFAAGQAAVQAAFLASEKAIDKAEASIEKRGDATYVAIGDLQKHLGSQMPRSEAEQRFSDHADRLAEVMSRLTTVEATKAGGKEQLTAIYAFGGFLLVLILIGGAVAAAGGFGGS